jgi:hypothetical protein
MKNSSLKPMEPAPWLREATRLFDEGFDLPDIVAALRRRGHSELAITFAAAALRSDASRRARVRPRPRPKSAAAPARTGDSAG